MSCSNYKVAYRGDFSISNATKARKTQFAQPTKFSILELSASNQADQVIEQQSPYQTRLL